jgi:hypothetical protein
MRFLLFPFLFLLLIATSGCATTADEGGVFGGLNPFSKSTPRTNMQVVTREALGDGTPGGTIVIEGREIQLPTQAFDENTQFFMSANFAPLDTIRGEDNAIEVLSNVEISYTRLTDSETAAQVALARSSEAQANVRALSTLGASVVGSQLGAGASGFLDGWLAFLRGEGGPPDPTEEAVNGETSP